VSCGSRSTMDVVDGYNALWGFDKESWLDYGF